MISGCVRSSGREVGPAKPAGRRIVDTFAVAGSTETVAGFTETRQRGTVSA